MFHRKEFNRKTGTYRSKDPIKNLKFKVSLRHINSLIKVPTFTISGSAPATSTPNEDETYVVSMHWQQKHFSKNETKRYADADKCLTDLHKKYHIQCVEQGPGDQIYTYTSEDCFMPNKECIARNVEYDLMPAVSATTEKMLVMANLLESVETALFTITWNADDGVLLVYPDFNDIATNPYVKEIDSDSRQLYQYAIENVSDGADEFGGMMEQALGTLTLDPAPATFILPPRRCKLAYVFLEIVCAEQFEYDNIHVRYTIRLPSRCAVFSDETQTEFNQSDERKDTVDNGVLEGTSHASKKCTSDGVYWLGFTHQFAVLCHDDFKFNEHIHIEYEAISIDDWDRERTEGFVVQVIPFEVSSSTVQLQCVRTLGQNTILERLRRYYVGNRQRIDIAAFYGLSIDKAGPLNRFGNITKSTGQLTVKTQVIIQAHPNDIPASWKNNAGRPINVSSSKSQTRLPTSISEVIAAYEKAKQRLEATTK